MKNKVLVLSLCVSGLLAGCSSKPDITDIEAQLKDGWGLCKGLRMTDLKKVNGVDKGSSYEMEITYKLEILNDMTAEVAWQSDAVCPSEMYKIYWAYGRIDGKYLKPFKKGDFINVKDVFNMVKSEKGWVSR